MATYPNGTYSPRTKENKAGVSYDADKSTIGYAEDVIYLDNEVVAIENELGTVPKGTSATVKEKIAGIRSLSDVVAVLLVIGTAASALTNYVRIKLTGEINLYGTARVERHMDIDAERIKLPGLNPPTVDQEGLFATLDFNRNTEQSGYFTAHIPFRWDPNTDIEVHVRWLHDGIDAGKVMWGVEYKSIKADETVAGASTTITQLSTGNHTAGELQDTKFTTKIVKANLENHDTIAVRFFRAAANISDNLDEDARMVQIMLHFTANKLGKATS